MTNIPSQPETSLQIRRTFSAPRERVFQAWTEPEEIKKWFGPGQMVAPMIAQVDLRAGGHYRFEMRSSENTTMIILGTYQEVQPPERLVYTWVHDWGDGKKSDEETLVTVEFLDQGDKTEVVLTHERFATKQECDGHQEGWRNCFEAIERYLSLEMDFAV